MNRRVHKKSRNGCSECKRRHTKCDERRPICVNCITVNRPCSYPRNGPDSSSGSPTQSCDTSSSTASTQHMSIQRVLANDIYIYDPQEDDTGVNIQHLELLHHFSTATYQYSGVSNEMVENCREIITQSGLSTPYLMHEILAIAARHLSALTSSSTKQIFYQNQATQLQTHAISLFNKSNPDVNVETCVPMFLFTSLLGVHVLCDTLAFRSTDIPAFLMRFGNYLALHRGVRAVTGKSWHLLRETELGPILRIGEALSGVRGTGKECDRLRMLIAGVDLESSAITACQQAVEYLQWAFDMRGKPEVEGDIVYMVCSWPLLVSAEFTDLLLREKPEALIILAYYAVLLHYCRDVWVVDDSGCLLIQSITKYLGKEWEEWLIWPTEVLRPSPSV